MTPRPDPAAAGSADDALVRLAARCLDLLRLRGETVSTAESLTAGLVAGTLAGVPGASDVLRGGLAAYATDVKVTVLGVDAGLVERHGVVSAECAEAMAVRARQLFDSTWAISTTGVAGPDRQEGRPVGTVFVAVAGPITGPVQVQALVLSGSRAEIRWAALREALDLLSGVLGGWHSPRRAGG